MRKVKVVKAYAMLLFLGILFLSFRPLEAQENPESLALAFLEALRRGAYESAWAMEDATMQSLMSQEALKEMWESMKRDLGDLESFEIERVGKKEPHTVVLVISRFERMTLLAQVAVNEEGRISGLYFLPYTASEYSPPPYAPERFSEKEVTFGVPGFELPGVLTFPEGEGPFPCLVLVHGSGANDRDETVGACKPFRDLALGLAREGIATLRYDKRTHVHGTKITPELSRFTVEEEVIEDALEAVEFLERQREAHSEQIFLLGHSLGGWLAPEIALRSGKIRGIILCAAPARALHELVPGQMEYLFGLDGVVDEKEKERLEEVRKIVEAISARTLKEDEVVPRLGGYARYYYSLMDLQPLESAQKLPCSVLVIQGGRDFQVREEDFLRWKEALAHHSDATFRFYPSLNHLLIPGEGPSTPEEYMKPGHVDEALIGDIASWVREVLQSSSGMETGSGEL